MGIGMNMEKVRKPMHNMDLFLQLSCTFKNKNVKSRWFVVNLKQTIISKISVFFLQPNPVTQSIHDFMITKAKHYLKA